MDVASVQALSVNLSLSGHFGLTWDGSSLGPRCGDGDRLTHAISFQAEEFRTAVHMLLEWLSEAEQTLRFRGALPDDTESLQSLIDVHKVGGLHREVQGTLARSPLFLGEL